jgi:capsular exopolysaccharide synthesis family protein
VSLRDTLGALRKRLRLLVVLALVGLGLATALATLAQPRYAATAELFVASQTSRDTASSNAYVDVLGTQSRLPSYIQLMTKEPLLQGVVSRLGLPYTWEQLASHVAVTNASSTTILAVQVTDPSASRARDVANAIAGSFPAYVDSLETAKGLPSPVKVTVVQQAGLPGAPASPKVPLYLAVGLVLGLAAGVMTALLREALDVTVKDAPDVRDRFDLPTLGLIPYDRDAAKNPLVVASSAASRRAEAIRQLRTNLQFVQIDEPPRSILITSSVSNEGKTMTACNTAIALAQAGIDVILIGADVRRPRLGEYMGLPDAAGLTSVLVGWAEIEDVLQDWGDATTRLRVLTAGPVAPNPSELLASDQMRDLLLRLEDSADIVIIDGPPLLPVADSAALAAITSGTLLVVRAGKTRREHVTQALETLHRVDARVYGAVLNMVKRTGTSEYEYAYSYDYVQRGPATAGPGGRTPFRRTSRPEPALAEEELLLPEHQ